MKGFLASILVVSASGLGGAFYWTQCSPCRVESPGVVSAPAARDDCCPEVGPGCCPEEAKTAAKSDVCPPCPECPEGRPAASTASAASATTTTAVAAQDDCKDACCEAAPAAKPAN